MGERQSFDGDKSSILTFDSSQKDAKKMFMSPDAFNAVIAESYSRLYGVEKSNLCEPTSDDDDVKIDFEEEEVANGHFAGYEHGKYHRIKYENEPSKSKTFSTHNLRESSKTIHKKIESQLNESKLQRIKTLQKVNKSWIFWFDRVGAILLFMSGILLFGVGITANVL